MRMDFAGKNVIITGGSSGIGKATARLLARYGANVFIVARRQRLLDVALDEIVAEKNRADQICRAFSADVSRREQIKAVVDAIVESGYHPDILINSAGIASCNYFDDLTPDDFRRTMDTNFFGTVHAVRAVLPHMKERRSGHIVNVSSVVGIVGIFGYTAYGATKFAVSGFSESLRMELKPYNVHVSVLFPPDTDTPQLAEENRTKPPETKAISGNVGMKQPEEVAAAMIKGMEQGKLMIVPGFMNWLTWTMKRLWPGFVFSFMDSDTAKAQKRAAGK